MFSKVNQPLVIAHRGASADAPENTLPAFELAARQGADQDPLQDPLVADRLDQVVQVPHGRARLVRIGLDGGERDHLADRRLVPGRELLDEVGVVAHLDARGQATLAGWLRHGSGPPPKGGSTHRLPSTAERR